LVFDLLLLGDNVLEIEQFDFKEVNDWLGGFWLAEIVEDLEEQEQGLNLEE